MQAESPSTDRTVRLLRTSLGGLLLVRLLYPFFASPLQHLFSDPQRHWENAGRVMHPDFMGSGDPLLYQLWLGAVRALSHDDPPWILLSCGLLCAAMPYGWYRALRERLPRRAALAGALAIGAAPWSWAIYSYFMNETLLLALGGFAMWLTLRAWRKRSLAAWTLASLALTLTVYTRVIMLPVALGCLAALWWVQSRRIAAVAIAVAVAAPLGVFAGLRAAPQLGYFAPLGNTYLVRMYEASGRRNIELDLGPLGGWAFGSPSFYNPTFAPFSDWTTARSGTYHARVDVTQGRDAWNAALAQATADSVMSPARRRWEGTLYLAFGQSWPDNDRSSLLGTLSLWNRWLLLPLALVVAWGAVGRRYRDGDWFVVLAGLGLIAFLAVQTTSTNEGRYRKPAEPLLLASVVLLANRGRRSAPHVRMPA